MPENTFCWQTHPRTTELGPAGTVTPAALLDWMQETAARHCDAAGYPVDRLLEEGAVWFVREFILDLRRPIEWRESVTVETWVSDVRRFRTHREYRVLVGGEVAAQAQADWLFLSRTEAGGVRPRRPPEWMKDAFPLREDVALETDTIPPWPGRDIAELFTPLGHPRRVVPSELDANDHVNHVRYLTWLTDGSQASKLGALGYARLEFLKDADVGDEVAVQASPDAGGVRHARIVRGEETLLRAVLRFASD